MKTQTAEEILIKHLDKNNVWYHFDDGHEIIDDGVAKTAVIEAMKEYAEQALDLAAEEAKVDINYEYNYSSACEIAMYSVDKDSILSLKYQLS